MKGKQVTIDVPSPIASSREAQSGRQTPSLDTTPRRSMYLSKHMLSPGQDGYRTPTIEDYELHNARSTPAGNGFITPVYRDPGLPNNNLPLELPYLTPGSDGRHHLDMRSTILAHSIFQKLEWRERIRHYTWSFFTMTMATGGIANVLYTGTVTASFLSRLTKLTVSRYSPISFSGPRNAWDHLLPPEHRPLHSQCCNDLPTILLLPRDVQGFNTTPH